MLVDVVPGYAAPALGGLSDAGPASWKAGLWG